MYRKFAIPFAVVSLALGAGVCADEGDDDEAEVTETEG